MVIIGITGSFGSGKSTVAEMLARMGNGCLIDADKIAKKIVSGKLRARVIREFGTANRKRLAEIVFSDKSKLERLNRMVHPEVKKKIKFLVEKADADLIIIDAPLLIETNIRVDKIIVVKASTAKRIERLKKFGKKDVLLRDKAQMPIDKKLKFADFVVDNNDPLKNTEKQVKKIWDKIKNDI